MEHLEESEAGQLLAHIRNNGERDDSVTHNVAGTDFKAAAGCWELQTEPSHIKMSLACGAVGHFLSALGCFGLTSY